MATKLSFTFIMGSPLDTTYNRTVFKRRDMSRHNLVPALIMQYNITTDNLDNIDEDVPVVKD